MYERSSYIPDSTNFRPLFQPTEDELRAEKLETDVRLGEIEAERLSDAKNERDSRFRKSLEAWRSSPNKNGISELLGEASDEGTSFAETAEIVAAVFQNNEIAGISANDLTQLLESYFWLLPVDERTPATSFRISEIIRELRKHGAKASKSLR